MLQESSLEFTGSILYDYRRRNILAQLYFRLRGVGWCRASLAYTGLQTQIYIFGMKLFTVDSLFEKHAFCTSSFIFISFAVSGFPF